MRAPLALGLMLALSTVVAQPADESADWAARVQAAIEAGDEAALRAVIAEESPGLALVLQASSEGSPRAILDATQPGRERDVLLAAYALESFDPAGFENITDPRAHDLTRIALVMAAYGAEGVAPPQDYCDLALRGGYAPLEGGDTEPSEDYLMTLNVCETTTAMARELASGEPECVENLPSRLRTQYEEGDPWIVEDRANAVAQCRAGVRAARDLEARAENATAEELEDLLAGRDALSCSLGGAWTSNYGDIRFEHDGSLLAGEYDWDQGQLAGYLSGRTFFGQWHEAPTRAAPNDAGDVEFVFTDDCATFTGSWRYGSGEGWSGSWSGARKPAEE